MILAVCSYLRQYLYLQRVIKHKQILLMWYFITLFTMLYLHYLLGSVDLSVYSSVALEKDGSRGA